MHNFKYGSRSFFFCFPLFHNTNTMQQDDREAPLQEGEKGKEKCGEKRKRGGDSGPGSDADETTAASSSCSPPDDCVAYSYVPECGYAEFTQTPYTLGVSPALVEKLLATDKAFRLMDKDEHPSFPWLLLDRGCAFQNGLCIGTYKTTRGDKNAKLEALVKYMNRFWCQLVDTEPPCLIKKVWRADENDWLLISRTNKEFQDELSDIKIYLRDDEEQDDAADGGKPLKPHNPAKLWLSSRHRRRYSRKVFDPLAYEKAIASMFTTDDTFASLITPAYSTDLRSDLNTFTGLAVEPIDAKSFVAEAKAGTARINGEESPMCHLGLVRAEFIDTFATAEDVQRFGMGTIITRYPSGMAEKGPPHPSNPLWEKHLEHLLEMVDTVEEATVYVDEQPDLPRSAQIPLLLRHFGRTGDPWGDCGFSLAPWLEFIYVVVCCKDWAVYCYVVSWCSSVLKNIGHPRTVAMDLYHRQSGGGKSMFCAALCAIIGEKWVWSTSEPNDIVGEFSGAAENKLIVFLDEVKLQKGNGGKQVNALKNLLSGQDVKIHRKYENVRKDRKWFSFMLTSNEDHFVVAQQGERRHCLLEIETGVCGQVNYLSSLYNLLHGTGRCFPRRGPKELADFRVGLGIVYWCDYLMRWDLDNWSEWPVPATSLLKDCQVSSMSPIARWWHGKLLSGYLQPTEALKDVWPIESKNTLALRPALVRKAALEKLTPTPPHLSAEDEYLYLENRKETMGGGRLSPVAEERLKTLKEAVETAAVWNPLWPKESLYKLSVEDSHAIKSYFIPNDTDFLKEMGLLLKGSGYDTKRYRVRTATMGMGEVPREAGNYSGFSVANAPVPPPPVARQTNQRVTYCLLPPLEEARAAFARSQQWSSFDSLEAARALEEQAAVAPWEIYLELNQLADKEDLMHRVTANTAQWLTKDMEKRRRKELHVSTMFGEDSEEEEEEETPMGGFAYKG